MSINSTGFIYRNISVRHRLPEIFAGTYANYARLPTKCPPQSTLIIEFTFGEKKGDAVH